MWGSKFQALIIQIEAPLISMYETIIKQGVVQGNPTFLKNWDPSNFLSHKQGKRLLEEIARQIRSVCFNKKIDYIALTLPGTIEGTSTIEGSSRLGIFESINVTEVCRKLDLPPTYVFHDAECCAIGELNLYLSKNSVAETNYNTFVYIIVDEGVGSSIFINGHPYNGAGVAGHLGRLVLQPYGIFNPTFKSRGTLEAFAARPWISQSVVNEYLAEKGKRGSLKASSNPFRAAVEAAASSGKVSQLTLDILAEGVKLEDPLLLTVLEEAAQNLGIAINAIITIMNPPLIMLGGGMITNIPGFSKKVIDYARRNAFAGSWNETTIHIANAGKESQILGTAHFLSKTIAKIS